MSVSIWNRGSTIQYFFILGLYSCGLLLFLHGLLLIGDNPRVVKENLTIKFPPVFKRIMLVMIDALRADFIFSQNFSHNWPDLNRIIKTMETICSISHADAPTLTMPRLKALLTGRNPKFIDLLFNLNADSLSYDSWVKRMTDNRWKLEFYGDNTWLKLFPNTFTRFEETSSFLLIDFFGPDKNVTRQVDPLLARPTKWDAAILHYNGVDQIGHVDGADGLTMPKKLAEMDQVVGRILHSFRTSEPYNQEPWLFILTGDHGITDRRGHGGSSYDETSTGLLMISSNSNSGSSENKSCEQPMESIPVTSQLDLATFIGLATGTGIPSNSIGVLPLSWLYTFWSDDFTRLTVVSHMLLHFGHLTGCSLYSTTGDFPVITLSPTCNNQLMKPDQITVYNNLVKQIAINMAHLKRSFNTAANSTTESSGQQQLKKVMNDTITLLRDVQTNSIGPSTKPNETEIFLGCFIMWLVTFYLIAYAFTELYLERDASAKFQGDNILLHPDHQPLLPPVLVKRLCQLCGAFLVLQTLSYGGTSFIEEEHQFWYYLSSSVLMVSAFLFVVDESTNWTGKRFGIAIVVIILTLDRALLRRLHQTGNKYQHLPHISDFLHNRDNSLWVWLLHLTCWLLLLALRLRAILQCGWRNRLNGRNRLLCWLPLISMGLVALSQLRYRMAQHIDDVDDTIYYARVSYLALLIDLIVSFFWQQFQQAIKLRQNFYFAAHESLWSGTLHPLATYPLLIILLGRPAVGLLWTIMLIKECLLSRLLTLLHPKPKHVSIRGHKLYLTFCWLVYWIQGWTSFFYQGNSISFATLDLSASIVGLRTSHLGIAGILLTVFTYAGPLFWQFAYLGRFVIPKSRDRQFAFELACMRLAFVILPLSFCAFICALLHTHIFLWTVFNPKVVYLSIFHVAFAPIFFVWGMKHTQS